VDTNEWSPFGADNLVFLKTQESNANDLLFARGRVTLNEVYDMLGFDRIPEGDTVGWFDRDDHISFDVFVLAPKLGAEFVAGKDKDAWVHFNAKELEDY
jgi:hypothetical protein